MKNCLWSVLVFFLVANTPEAQTNSIVHLKSGSVFIGELLDDAGVLVHMRLTTGEELAFSKNAVRYYLPGERILVHDKGKYHIIRGIFFNISFGINMGNIFEETNSRISSHLTFIFGYNFKSRYALGLGFGSEFNEATISGFNLDTQFAPLFLYGRYYLLSSKARPFIYSRIGYGFIGDGGTFANDHTGGMQWQTGGGLHFASRKNLKFLLSLGYHLQQTNGTERFLDPFGNEILTEYHIWIRRMILKVGIEFHWNKGKY